ncbi:MAG TPA: fused response regulator/phosphatase, partial [Cyanobacteria bacterium UBA8530]|nr:fused response regulator/phosphatase [Cyanobacteria bacterium UBA8530]
MKKQLLVIDDEPDLEVLIRQRFRRQIRGGEMEFFFARNGEEALELLENEPQVEVVLTDINMPVMDGLTFLSRLGEKSRLLKAVVVSAYGDMDNIRRAMNLGAFDFVTKPIDFDDLDLTVSKTVKQVQEMRDFAETQKKLHGFKQELDIARNIQESMIPRVFPEKKEFSLFGDMIPAQEVGGDFYDFFEIDEERLGLVIADVSGKGISAALFMAISRTLMRATAMTGMSPDECLIQVNDLLARENPNSMFVTLFYAVLNKKSGEITYSDGGHNPPFLIREGGKVEMLKKVGGMAMGWLEGFKYRPGTLQLKKGETLFLYTDG